MKFSVCVASVRADTLNATINAIRNQQWQDWELIVVGQGQDEAVRGLVKIASAKDPRIIYLYSKQPGASRGRNLASSAASGDIIAFTDDDCEPGQNWLPTLAQYFTREPEVGVVAGAVIAPPKKSKSGLALCPSVNPPELLYDPVAHQLKEPAGWGWISANVALRRQVIEQVGGFDEYLGPGTIFRMGEDTDYRLRLAAAGIKTRTTPDSIVYHSYGYRYGLRPVLELWRSYAISNGAIVGKLKMLDDPRAQSFLERSKNLLNLNLLKQFQPHLLLLRLLNLTYYFKAYHFCLKEFEVDRATCLLKPVPGYPRLKKLEDISILGAVTASFYRL